MSRFDPVGLSDAQLENEARHWERQAEYHFGYPNALDRRWHAKAVEKARLCRNEQARRRAATRTRRAA